jgi:hypothetical protein
MPINLPNLDDRTYAGLIEEALAMIPVHAPEWTNHNPSDPGITLIELFAYLAEMMIYRLNRVTDDQVKTFLRLINADWKPTKGKPLDEEIRDVILELRKIERAVTRQDFEVLAIAAPGQTEDYQGPLVARAHCLPDKPQSVRVVIVPETRDQDGNFAKPASAVIDDLVKVVKKYLEPKCLLTTKVAIEGPKLLDVWVTMTLVPEFDGLEETLRKQADEALRRYLDPLRGGPDGSGWPFGRAVYVSEIYQLLDDLPGVAYVKESQDPLVLPSTMSDSERATRLKRDQKQQLIAVELLPDELVYPGDLKISVEENCLRR